MKRLSQISHDSVWMFLLLAIVPLWLLPGTVKATTYHTVTFTGTPSSDFAADEVTTTSTGSVNAYLTWDASNLYLAFDNANNSEPVVIYIDTDPQSTPTNGTGTTTGFNYDGVTPSLPFTANFVAYMKNGSPQYNEYRTWTGSAWSSNTANAISTYFGTNSEEYSIPWSAMGGKPSQIYFLMYKDNGSTYIYGQAPTQVSDGTNSSPSFAHWYSDNVTTNVSPFAGSDISLAVQMSSYSAAYSAKGVTLSWRTQSEVNNAGFNILRKAATDASYSTIAGYKTDSALKGLGTSTSGKSYSYTDASVSTGVTYDYKIREVSTSGGAKDFGPILVAAGSQTPSRYALEQNYPDPFNPTTTINVDVVKSGYARLEIFNSLGQRVATLFDGSIQAGIRHFVWNASGFASGVYFYRFTSAGFSAVHKMVLMK